MNNFIVLYLVVVGGYKEVVEVFLKVGVLVMDENVVSLFFFFIFVGFWFLCFGYYLIWLIIDVGWNDCYLFVC